MKSNIFYPTAIAVCLLSAACQPKSTATVDESMSAKAEVVTSKIADCKVTVGDITFTNAINGADSCAKVLQGGALEFRCPQGYDFFCDPNQGKLTSNSLPILLVPVDNTQPFTLTAKVTPEFSADGLYNAADLFVYVDDTLWQKLAFEQDEYGNHRIVSVRTQGTSDDNNHEKQDVASVYLKISSDTHTIANYYSLDKKEWRMVRLYRNYYPANIYLGVSSQCPQRGHCTSLIEEIELKHDSVTDFRMGD